MPLTIAIVGAGIGGLSAAATLRKAGHCVEVLPYPSMLKPKPIKLNKKTGLREILLPHRSRCRFSRSAERRARATQPELLVRERAQPAKDDFRTARWAEFRARKGSASRGCGAEVRESDVYDAEEGFT